MKKIITITGAAVLALSLFSPAALADDESSNPAVNRNECADAGGEFWTNGENGNDRVQTCTVGNGQDQYAYGVDASHPTQAWTVDLRIPGATTVYRFQPAATPNFTEETTGSVGDAEVIACYNHRGNPISDFETNAHCVPGE